MAQADNTGSFVPVFESKTGIGGYPLTGVADHIFAFDGSSAGKLDHLVLYEPGVGRCYVLRPWQGQFYPIYQAENQGIGGFDLMFSYDRAMAFDFDHSGKADHILACRPGSGGCFILSHDGQGTFTPVYAQSPAEKPTATAGNGLGDAWNFQPLIWDRVFPYDYEHSKRNDYLCIYRRFQGDFCIVQHTSPGVFKAVYKSMGGGIGGYKGGSEEDYAFAFDYDHSGCMDHIIWMRPQNRVNANALTRAFEERSQEFHIIAHQSDKFVQVFGYSGSGTGLGGFDIRVMFFKMAVFDFASAGKMDHVVLCRPGYGTCWILTPQGGSWSATYKEGTTIGKTDNGGKGIGTWDLSDNLDHVIAFDYDGSGLNDHLIFYRMGTGKITILKRADHVTSPDRLPQQQQQQSTNEQWDQQQWAQQQWAQQ